MRKSKGGMKWRRLLSILLTLTLIFSTCSITAFAEEASENSESTSSGTNDNKVTITEMGEASTGSGDTTQTTDDSTNTTSGEEQTKTTRGDDITTGEGQAKTTSGDDITTEEEQSKTTSGEGDATTEGNNENQVEGTTQTTTTNQSTEETKTESTTKTGSSNKVTPRWFVKSDCMIDDYSYKFSDGITEANGRTKETTVLLGNDVECEYSIEINSNVVLDLSSYTLTVKAVLTNNGTIKTSDSGGIKISENGEVNLNSGKYNSVKFKMESGSKLNINGGEFTNCDFSEIEGTMSVTGGTFDTELLSDYIANGYVAIKNSDGTYTVSKQQSVPSVDIGTGSETEIDTKVVASVGSTTYSSLEEAINAASSNDDNTIKLLLDTTISEDIIIGSGTLDLNGKNLNVESGKTLTISGATLKSGNIYVYGNLTVTGGTFSESAIIKEDSGTISIMGGTFDFNPSIYVASGWGVSISSDNTYMVSKKQMSLDGSSDSTLSIASVGDSTYTSFIGAVNDASENQTVKLLANDVINSLTIDKGITVDLNGYTLTIGKGYTLAISDGYFKKGNGNIVVSGTFVITGGSFDFNPEEYVDTEKYSITNNNGTYTVSVKESADETLVVKNETTNVSYDTLSEAISASNKDESLKLYKNVNIASNETITINKDIILDLNSYSLTVDGTLTVSAGTIKGNIQVNSGTLNVTGGTFDFNPTTYIDGNDKLTYRAFKNSDNTYTVAEYITLTFENAEVSLTSDIGYTIEADKEGKYYAMKDDKISVVLTKLNYGVFGNWFYKYDDSDSSYGDGIINTQNFDIVSADRNTTYMLFSPVARVGKAEYEDLSEAISEALATSLEVELLSDTTIDIDNTITLKEDFKFANTTVYKVTVNGSLTITGGDYSTVEFVRGSSGKIEISGGTFYQNPTDYLVDGYYVVSENGKYTVEKYIKIVVGASEGYETITVKINNNLETLNDDGSYYVKKGDSITISVAMPGSIEFKGWYADEAFETDVISMDNPYSFNAKDDVISYYAYLNYKYVAYKDLGRGSKAYFDTIVKALNDNGYSNKDIHLYKDGTIEEKVDVIQSFNVKMENHSIIVNSGGKLTLPNNSNTYDGTFVVNDGGKIVIYGGTFDSDFKVNEGKLTIFGGTFNGKFEVGENGNIEISGGQYKEKPDDSYCVDGKMFSEDTTEDGYYTVVPIVATIGSQRYSSLDNAIKNASENGVIIKLQKDITISDDISLPKDVTVDLNGNSLTIVGGTYYGNFAVGSNSTISISGGTFGYEPNYKWIQSGYAAFKNADGNYDVIATVRITVLNAKDGNSKEQKDLAKGSRVIVSAVSSYNEKGNQYSFSKWVDSDGMEKSTRTSYSFIANNDIQLEAVYEMKEKEIEKNLELTFTASTYGTQQILFEEYRVNMDYTLVNSGILLGAKADVFGGKSDEELDSLLKPGKSGVVNYPIRNPSNKGYSRVRLNIGTKTTTIVYARSYVTVLDADGKEKTFYSKVINVTYEGLAEVSLSNTCNIINYELKEDN